MTAALRYDDSKCYVSMHDGVVLIDIRSGVTDEHVAAATALTERAAESRGGTAGVLVRVMAGVAIPGTSARNALIDYMRIQRDRVRNVHVVLEGHGFWAATMTALVATVSRAANLEPAIHVYDRLERAVPCLVSRLEASTVSIDSSELVRAFDRTRH